MKAMDRYKRENRRPFPTWSEVLEVLRSLGYRRVAEPGPLPGGKKEKDSRRDTDAPARPCRRRVSITSAHGVCRVLLTARMSA